MTPETRQKSSFALRLIRRVLLFFLLPLCLLTGSAFLYLRHRYPPEKIREELAAALTRRSGFSVTVGEVDYTWTGHIRIAHLCLRNAQMKDTRCTIDAHQLELDVSLFALLQRRTELRSVRIQDLKVQLFEEVREDVGKKNRVVLRSFDRATSAQPVTNDANGSTALLAALEISQGELVRDMPLAPLPRGRSRFALQYRGGQNATLTTRIFFDNGGEASIAFSGEGNLPAIATAIMKSRDLPTASLSGKVTCTHCPLDSIDRRLTSVSGGAGFTLNDQKLLVETQAATIGIVALPGADFSLNAKLPLQLKDFTVSDASGTLNRPGLAIQFAHLNTGMHGTRADFQLNADLAALNQPGLSGRLTGQGRIDQGKAAADLSITAFSLAAGRGMTITSAAFKAKALGEILSVARQPFALNGQAFTATLTVARSAGIQKVNGTLDFPELDLSPAAPEAQGSGNAAARRAVDITVRLKAGQFRYGKWRLAALAGNVTYNQQGLDIDEAEAVFAKGQIRFAYKRPLSGAQKLRFEAQGLQAQALSESLELPAKIYGPLNASANFSFEGDNMEAFRRSASGSLTMSLGRGKVKDSFVQKGVLTGPLHKLEEKFADIEFASANLDARFVTGVMTIKKLHFDAEEWNVLFKAEADATGKGRAALDFRFRQSFVENAANPLHLGISSRKDGDFYDLPFACRGNVFSAACYKQNW